MSAYYNEIDKFAAAQLQELMKAGRIASGDIDTRSIEDVEPSDLKKYTQCHFFAGLGVWSYALRRAGWSDDRPVWTGSCPCQPFSAAGKGTGFSDERHLWPAFHHLIENAKPRSVPVFGEQVASKDGLAWLDLVQADMEGSGYTVGAADSCSAGFGAPHIRQRLYWVAHASSERYEWRRSSQESRIEVKLERSCNASRLADASDSRREHGTALAGGYQARVGTGWPGNELSPIGDFGALAITESIGSSVGKSGNKSSQKCPTSRDGKNEGRRRPDIADAGITLRTGQTNGFWRNADWIKCRDGKWRPVEPGLKPLVNGAPARVGRLRGYGNAINAEQAQAFVEAGMNYIAIMEYI